MSHILMYMYWSKSHLLSEWMHHSIHNEFLVVASNDRSAQHSGCPHFLCFFFNSIFLRFYVTYVGEDWVQYIGCVSMAYRDLDVQKRLLNWNISLPVDAHNLNQTTNIYIYLYIIYWQSRGWSNSIWLQVGWMLAHHSDKLSKSNFSSILDNSVILWAGTQSAENCVPVMPGFKSYPTENNLLFYSKSLLCAVRSLYLSQQPINNIFCLSKPCEETLHWEYFIINYNVYITTFWIKFPISTAMLMVVNGRWHLLVRM